MKIRALFGLFATLLAIPSVFAAQASQGDGQGQAVITVLPKGEAIPNLTTRDLQLKINGKESNVTGFQPAKGAESPLELVILMDSSARSSIGTQMGEIQSFVKEMPADSKIALAYMQNGRAAFASPLSADSSQVLKGLRLPGGMPGSSSSPYFCLSDLAQHWPSNDRTARREVLMITDGVDYYNLRYDPEDPYVQAAISDSAKAGLVVYSIYWTNTGRLDRSAYENNAGQNLLNEVTQATGGNSYWEGMGNPVSFEPYFKDLRLRFDNQYRLNFSSNLKGKPQVQTMNLKVGGLAAKVTSPKQVFVTASGTATGE